MVLEKGGPWPRQALGERVSDVLRPCALAKLEQLVQHHVAQEVDVRVDVPAALGVDLVL